jgi:hypothetical protein
MQERLRRIRENLAMLQNNKHAIHTIFGAKHHQFRVNPPIDPDELANVEQTIGIRLPKTYRSFLLEVGNGGAGTWHGLLPLGESITATLREELEPTDLHQPFPHTQGMQFHDAGGSAYYDGSRGDYEDPRFVQGSLILCYRKARKDVQARYRLIVAGPERSNMWVDERERNWALRPCRQGWHGIGGDRVDFLEWYETWLEDCRICHQFSM